MKGLILKPQSDLMVPLMTFEVILIEDKILLL